MRSLLTLIFFGLAAVTGYANGHGIAYYVLRTDDAKVVLARPFDEKASSAADLESRSLLHGYFLGSCNLYLKTKEFQFRIEAVPTDLVIGATHEFHLSMFSQLKREDVFQCSGFVKIDKSLSAPKDWQSGEFTVLFRPIVFKR